MDVYTRFPSVSSGSVEMLVWAGPSQTASGATGGTVDLDVVLLDETAGARVGMLAGAAAIRITFSGAGVYVNGMKCPAASTGPAWHRLGVAVGADKATVSLDGAVLRTVPYPFAVSSLEFVGRGLDPGAGPACVDNVRVVAAAAALSASSA